MRAARMPGPSPETAGATTSDSGFEKLAARLGGCVGLAFVRTDGGVERGVCVWLMPLPHLQHASSR